MNNIVSRVLTEVLGARRFKWHGMAAAWLVCIAGWLGVALIPSEYESKAVLYIDTASVLRPLLADLAVNTDVMSEVRMMSEVLLSRPQVERVVRDTDLYLRADTPAEMEALLKDVRERIQVTGGSSRNAFSKQNRYTIKFVDQDPQSVHAVVQSLLDSFVESSLGQNRADSVGAQQFIQDQIEQYERRLATAEQELANFKRKNVGLMPSEGQDYYGRMQMAIDELDRLQEQQNAIVTRRRELQRQIEGEEPSFGLLTAPDSGSSPRSAASSGIETYERELETLLLKYTDKHPKVIDLRNRINQLRERQVQSTDSSSNQSGPTIATEMDMMTALDGNPVYQSLKFAIAEANADYSEIRQKITAAQARVANLREMVDAVPEIEAQLARLNRDYEVNKAQHTALLRRLESARLSEEAESRTDDIKFRVIEPPVIPLEPVGPNRNFYASVVLFAGFGIGGALAFLLSHLNPVFNSADDVRRSLQLPVLGSIPAFRTAEQKAASRRSIRRFAYAAVGLVALYGVTIMIWPWVNSIRQAIEGVVA